MAKYPLEQLQLIKKRRLEEAERLLKQKKEELAQEQKKLKTLEEERNITKKHRLEKLEQLREDMDAGAGAVKIEIAKKYLETVDVELEKKERAVKEQVKRVEHAEKAVEDARKDMLQKQQDVEKLKEHKIEWKKEARAEEQQKENVLSDELGTATYNLRKRRK